MEAKQPEWLTSAKNLDLGSTGSYDTRYWVYRSRRMNHTLEEVKKSTTLKKIENTNSACFARFSTITSEFKNKHGELPSRLLYHTPIKSVNRMNKKGGGYPRPEGGFPQGILEDEELLQWIELCVQHGFLPEYVDAANYAKTSEVVIKLNGLDINLLFFYLNNCRYMNEKPGICRATLHIYNKGKIPFVFAYILGHHQFGNCGGHAALDRWYGGKVTKDKYGYNTNGKIGTTKDLVKAAHRLRRFIKRANNKKYMTPIEAGNRWNLQTKIDKIPNKGDVPKSVSAEYDSLRDIELETKLE